MWRTGIVTAYELGTALMLWIPAVVMLFGRRGVSFSRKLREFRVWYGFGFTRSFAWPVWQGKTAHIRFVAVRLKRSTHPNTPGSSVGTTRPFVYLVDEHDRWITVGRALTIKGAERKAAEIAGETGLPLQ
jgi:hypothetical protein